MRSGDLCRAEALHNFSEAEASRYGRAERRGHVRRAAGWSVPNAVGARAGSGNMLENEVPALHEWYRGE